MQSVHIPRRPPPAAETTLRNDLRIREYCFGTETARAKTGEQNICELVCYHLDRLGWNYADLSEGSHISKTTICRIVSNLDHRGNIYRTSIEVIAAFAIAFQLNDEEANELFRAAFPQFQIWKEARDKHLSVTDTNILLSAKVFLC